MSKTVITGASDDIDAAATHQLHARNDRRWWALALLALAEFEAFSAQPPSCSSPSSPPRRSALGGSSTDAQSAWRVARDAAASLQVVYGVIYQLEALALRPLEINRRKWPRRNDGQITSLVR
jgi:hypothetical protein